MDGISQNKDLSKVLLPYLRWYSYLSSNTIMGTVAPLPRENDRSRSPPADHNTMDN